MKFKFVRNCLPQSMSAVNVGGILNMLTSEMLACPGDQIAIARSAYDVNGQRHRLAGLWRSEGRECGVAVTQADKRAPVMTLSLVATIRVRGWQTKQIWPAMLCLQSTGPFMTQIVLRCLEAFDEHDPDLEAKLMTAWAELVDRYWFDGSNSLARITSYSYRRGLNRDG